jgi:hypothetical protein
MVLKRAAEAALLMFIQSDGVADRGRFGLDRLVRGRLILPNQDFAIVRLTGLRGIVDAFDRFVFVHESCSFVFSGWGLGDQLTGMGPFFVGAKASIWIGTDGYSGELHGQPINGAPEGWFAVFFGDLVAAHLVREQLSQRLWLGYDGCFKSGRAESFDERGVHSTHEG